MSQSLSALEGAPNFREIGGYVGRDGRRVRGGQFYRSQGLNHLTDADLDVIRRLHIRLLCDLRSHAEQSLHPTRWPAELPTQRLDLNVNVDIRARNATLLDMLRQSPGAEGARAMMIYSYRCFPHNFAVPLRRMFSAMLDAGTGIPALVHCSAGKDRTGFVVAMVLSALGVDRDTIFTDYLETMAKIDRQQLMKTTEAALIALLGYSPGGEALEVISSVVPEFLHAALDTIDTEFGSVDRYLHEVCGLDRNALQMLESLLLE